MNSKLQDMLDAAFGHPPAAREPQQPSEACIQQRRAFDERARKIEALRQLRLTTPMSIDKSLP